MTVHPYKIQMAPELKPGDCEKRLAYSRAFLRLFRGRWATGKNRLIMSDEAHFHLGGFVNKHNCRIWATENPHSLRFSQTHPQKVTVWCGVTHDRIIGPHFFEHPDGTAATVNGERYREMLQAVVQPAVDQIAAEEEGAAIWFQQDGATCHTAKETMAVLRGIFGKHVISQDGDMQWPPRSPDLTAPDFFLWGFLKERVYASNPQNRSDLKGSIEREIRKIDEATLRSVMDSALSRARSCIAYSGGHLRDVVFHT